MWPLHISWRQLPDLTEPLTEPLCYLGLNAYGTGCFIICPSFSIILDPFPAARCIPLLLSRMMD